MALKRALIQRFGLSLISALSLIAFWPATASANPIIHPASYILPIAWFLLIPVIFIEARIAQRILGWDFRWSVSVSFIANFISTLVGIPVSLLSPLPILSYADRVWFFPVLLIPLYVVSVLCEGFIMSLFRELYASRRPSWRWALIANGVTYLMILAILVFWLLVIYGSHPPDFERGPRPGSGVDAGKAILLSDCEFEMDHTRSISIPAHHSTRPRIDSTISGLRP